MDSNHPQSRREYRRHHKLSRNNSFLADPSKLKPGNTVLRAISLAIILIVSVSVAWASHLYFSVHSAVDNAYQGNGQTSQQIANRKPISVLILGVDQGIEGRHDRGNSDTMILATANPQRKQATLTSIPRDLYVDIKGDPDNAYFMSRVNAAYQVGGNKAASKTVSALLNTPVNYYMEVNMKALQDLVNAVGGVDVDVPFAFTYNTTFHKGKMHLNGKEALDYARMRKEDPRGDYGRQQRQRQIIMSIVKEAMSLKSVNNYRKILRAFSSNVRTNMSFGDMVTLATNYRSVGNNIKSDYIHGHDAWIGGAAIQVASTKELQRVSDLVRTNLGLGDETLDNQETRQNSLNNKNSHLDWKDPNPFNNYIIYDQNSDHPWSDSSSSSDDSNSSDTNSDNN